MGISKKEIRLFHIRIYFVMFLFSMCLTMNASVCITYNSCESLNNITVIETGRISESIDKEDSNNTNYYTSSFLERNNYHAKPMIENLYSVSIFSAILKIFSWLLIRIIVFYLILFIFLPNGWTLINQKIRMYKCGEIDDIFIMKMKQSGD